MSRRDWVEEIQRIWREELNSCPRRDAVSVNILCDEKVSRHFSLLFLNAISHHCTTRVSRTQKCRKNCLRNLFSLRLRCDSSLGKGFFISDFHFQKEIYWNYNFLLSLKLIFFLFPCRAFVAALYLAPALQRQLAVAALNFSVLRAQETSKSLLAFPSSS